jgi:hypothetical protein
MLQRQINEKENARRAELYAQRQKEEQEKMRQREEEYKQILTTNESKGNLKSGL